MGYVNGREDYIVATGDALPLVTNPFNAIYGFQIHPITGGDQTSSIKVDLDGNPVNILDKFIYGDVDVRVAPICPDVALTKYVDDNLSAVGESITFTIVVENLDAPVTGTTVFDPLPAGLTFNGVYTATTGIYDGTNWTIGTMSHGQKDSIQITAVVNAEGVIMNTAVVAVNEIEDNIFNNEDNACVSVPIGACEDEAYQYELVGQAGLMTYQWYKDDIAIMGATMQSYIVTEPGSYTYTADGLPPTGDCAGELCCPVIIEEVSCCAPIKCIPVNLTINSNN